MFLSFFEVLNERKVMNIALVLCIQKDSFVCVRYSDADGADHHPACRLGAGVLHQASLQEGEAYRHPGRDARLVPRAGIGVQSARNIRGHDGQAAALAAWMSAA